MSTKIAEIAKNFHFDGELVDITQNNQGNINTTYILTYKANEGEKKYLLQKINANVFKEPYLVMKNIELVTNHIQKKLSTEKDQTHKTLNIIKTVDNENLFTHINESGEKEYYRAFDFIDHCISYDSIKETPNPEFIAYQVGKSFGNFQRLLDDAPITLLNETIKDFHNTPNRFDALLQSIKNQGTNRAYEFADEIIDLISKVRECSIIMENLGKTIPIRVTHNDTKLNNVLIDKISGEGVAIIDLDTVMPGSALFDVGDGIRSACSNSKEDEKNRNEIFIDMNLTKAYLRGYLEEMADYLSHDEIIYLGLSIKVLTYELAIRFLTDYINGDTYFKIKYKEHNRDRFLNQYTLLQDIERRLSEINEYINKTVEEIKGNKRALKYQP